MPIINVDGSGIRAQSLAENSAEIFNDLNTAFGGDLSASPQTPQAQIAGITGLRDTELGERAVRSALSGSSIDHASDTYLDAMASLLGIERQDGLPTRVTAQVGGAAGTILPIGTRARTTGGDTFQTTQAVTLPDGTTADVVFESLERDAVNCPAGSLTQIVTTIPGWSTVTNAVAGAVGHPRQSDASFRRRYLALTARRAEGPLAALKSGIADAQGGRNTVIENYSDMARTEQQFRLAPHSIFCVVESGLSADITNAIESRKGMGVAPRTAIISAVPSLAALNALGQVSSSYGSWRRDAAVASGEFQPGTTDIRFSDVNLAGTNNKTQFLAIPNGTVLHLGTTRFTTSGKVQGSNQTRFDGTFTTGSASDLADQTVYELTTVTTNRASPGNFTFGGKTFTSLDLSSANSLATYASALDTALGDDGTCSLIDGRFFVFFTWFPGSSNAFGSGAIEAAYGLTAALATQAPGPFTRPRERPLTVTAAITRQPTFPADGVDAIRDAIINRVKAYNIGEQLWLNDLLAAAEGVGGTRVTAITCTHNGAAVSGVAVPLDSLWTLSSTNLTLTVT